jgi:hypothetical protein
MKGTKMTITETTPRTQQNIGQDFILAGKAIFTLIGRSARFTYRVSMKADPGQAPVYFVGLLTGANNETDYSYLGLLDPVTGYVRLTRKSRMGADAPAVKAIQWALPRIWSKATMPAGFGIMHAGRCGRCGRTLTVPESRWGWPSGRSPRPSSRTCRRKPTRPGPWPGRRRRGRP